MYVKGKGALVEKVKNKMIYYDITCKKCKKTMSEMFVRMLVNGELKLVPCGLLCSCGYHEVNMEDVDKIFNEVD